MSLPLVDKVTGLPAAEAARRLAALFPALAVEEVWGAVAYLPLSCSAAWEGSLLSPASIVVSWQGQSLALPHRLYAPEPAPGALGALSSQQRQVVHCLYLRHHDGYVRQRHLEGLFAFRVEEANAFTTPFVFSLLGEYVQEILLVIAQHLTPARLARYRQLINENPFYWRQTQDRVVSYWDAYYRVRHWNAPPFRDYVGARILGRLHEAIRETDA